MVESRPAREPIHGASLHRVQPDPVRMAQARPRPDPGSLDAMRRLPPDEIARNPRAAMLEGRTVEPCLMSAEPVRQPHERINQ